MIKKRTFAFNFSKYQKHDILRWKSKNPLSLLTCSLVHYQIQDIDQNFSKSVFYDIYCSLVETLDTFCEIWIDWEQLDDVWFCEFWIEMN